MIFEMNTAMDVFVVLVVGLCIGVIIGAVTITLSVWLDSKHNRLSNSRQLWEEMELVWRIEP